MSIQDISSEEEFQKATRDSNYKGTVAFFNGGCSNARNSQIKSADFEALSKVYPTLKFIRLEVNQSMEVSQIFEQTEAFDPWPVFQVYKNGEKIGHLIEATKDTLESFIKSFA